MSEQKEAGTRKYNFFNFKNGVFFGGMVSAVLASAAISKLSDVYVDLLEEESTRLKNSFDLLTQRCDPAQKQLVEEAVQVVSDAISKDLIASEEIVNDCKETGADCTRLENWFAAWKNDKSPATPYFYCSPVQSIENAGGSVISFATESDSGAYTLLPLTFSTLREEKRLFCLLPYVVFHEMMHVESGTAHVDGSKGDDWIYDAGLRMADACVKITTK